MLTCNAGPEHELDHTPTIREHYVFLVDNLDPKHSGLVGELYQAGVLSREERDIISSEVISFTQNEKLLSMLSRKTTDQFDKFLDALDNTGQQHVRNVITGRQGQLAGKIVYCCLFLSDNATQQQRPVLSLEYFIKFCRGAG